MTATTDAGPLDRERFDRAQRRHRRNARLRAIPATLAAAVMGIPLGVYLSPVMLALAIVVTDLVNLVIPAPDLGGAVWSLLDRLLNGDPGALQAIVWVLLVWLIPGVVLLVVAYLLVAWRLRRVGGDGIALRMGGRPPRDDDAEEHQLVDVVGEFATAAGIQTPRVMIYDAGGADALVFGRDPDHATVLVARELLETLDREETQGIVARLLAAAVDGDLRLAIDIAAVYVTYGLLTTTLASFVSRSARARWRAAIGPLVGRRGDPAADAAGLAALLGLPVDDDTPDTTAGGCLTLLTMGGLVGIGISLINLFLSGPLLTFAWRSRGYLADATSVDLTRDPDGLARAVARLASSDRGGPGTAWLELLLAVGGGGGHVAPGAMPRLSDSGLTVSLAPPIDKRLRRLRAMGASVEDTVPDGLRPTRAGDAGGANQPPRRRLGTALLIAVVTPLIALVAVLLVIAVALIVYLVAIAAFFVLAIVAGPLHEILRGLAGR
jgi:Zn-dependent protease with chaperone function